MPVFEATPVYGKLVEATHKYRDIIMEGGSRSSKTWSIYEWLIEQALEFSNDDAITITVCRNYFTEIEGSSFKDFKDVMTQIFHIWNDSRMNKKGWYYTFETGSVLKFIGLDGDKGKQKATGLNSDIIFLNECVYMDWEVVQQATLRCKMRIYDFNPHCDGEHWLYSKVAPRDTAIRIHSTFKDNPFLDPEVRKTILNYEPTPDNIKRGTADNYFWNVYGLGKYAILKGKVFDNYEVIDEFPDLEFSSIGYGLDFGYNDPAAMCLCAQKDGNYYIDQLLYKRELINLKGKTKAPSLEEELENLKVNKKLNIYGDCEDRKGIEDLNSVGYRVVGVKKGAGSVRDGVLVMRRYKIFITKRSIDLKHELDNYKWAQDKNGKFLDNPIGKNDHLIDAARYFLLSTEAAPGFITRRKYQIDTSNMKLGADKYDIWGKRDDFWDDPQDED